MMLLVVGCSHQSAPLTLRERLAFSQVDIERACEGLLAQYGCETVVVSTCNRVEMYAGQAKQGGRIDSGLLTRYLSEFHRIPIGQFSGCLYEFHQWEAIRHLFRVVSSLESMVLGEGQICGQVQEAYETANRRGAVGPVLHTVFQHAQLVAKRVRTETGIARGHVSVSTTAVDYVRQVFDHFGDKNILLIGAGKMGELALRHLKDLKPKRIWIINRSPDKAQQVAQECGGAMVPWEQLDDLIARADIILSTTGAPEPIVSFERFAKIRARRGRGPLVILDIAVPRDFDPRIHDGETTCLFNIDDLHRARQQTLKDRQKHVAQAEAIIAQELERLQKDWKRRKHAPIIAQLTRDFEAKREAIVRRLMARLNGRLTDEDKQYVEGAFRLLQNQFLHGPISALAEEPHESAGHTLLEALRKLFRL
jgi:glutamyl-tRNA reductase